MSTTTLATATALPTLTDFVPVFEDTIVRSVHDRQLAGVTFVLPHGNDPAVREAVDVVLDALNPALRAQTVALVMLTASFVCASGMILSSAVNGRWHNPTQRIPIYLATFDIIGCTIHLTDHLYTMMNFHTFGPRTCSLLGGFFQFWVGTQVAMVSYLAFNIGACARARKNVDWGRWDYQLLVPTFLLSGLQVLPGAVLNVFGSSGYWCFIDAKSEYSFAANILYRLVAPTIGVLVTCYSYGSAAYELRKDMRVTHRTHKAADRHLADIEKGNNAACETPGNGEEAYESECDECDAISCYSSSDDDDAIIEVATDGRRASTRPDMREIRLRFGGLITNSSNNEDTVIGTTTLPVERHYSLQSCDTAIISQSTPQPSIMSGGTSTRAATMVPTSAACSTTAAAPRHHRLHRACRHHRHAAIHMVTAYMIAFVAQWAPVIIYLTYIAIDWRSSGVPLAANAFFYGSGIAHYGVYAALGRGNLLKGRSSRAAGKAAHRFRPAQSAPPADTAVPSR
ncbi:hypothetical protein THASP1DRAFT_32438 [Thamnocephalis sphaerospora]|uniref:G-protein coupled receptors family 2 profile 2 domain-containing protein n=1 Tax=Thamnocephalis sphaerospora TaxID=78915 RepID=A0A4P9XK04_9FUNG|nr:hypothetical protein THASP1DRAFT_32438 [Thamnocephalis sphaerospora]|eukprot:RKP05721.1 hypothetical protein THASP1DRAFT_32438 [Thamnocephalis sphaerospora]